MSLPQSKREEIRKRLYTRLTGMIDTEIARATAPRGYQIKDGGRVFSEGTFIINIMNTIDTEVDAALKEQRERFVEFLSGEVGYTYKHIEPDASSKGHGSCCYCGGCGHFNDSCVCENNRIYQFLQSLQEPLEDNTQ